MPDWAKDAVWYQVFPERFRNGSRANDPRNDTIPGWRITSWGRDWYAQDAWERKRGGFFKSVFDRRYGGDLIGLREKLDYLQDLGVNALYLNPIFHAPSLHKYDASSLHHVDPFLGPDPEGDLRAIAAANETEDPATWIWTAADRYFLDLVAELHRRGLRVILDGVFNHTGRGFFAFQNLLQRGRTSRYADWYKIDRWNADGSFAYTGWFGHASLPEFRQTPDNLAQPVRRYLFDITRRWMAPAGDAAAGIDGWRLDVAFCLPHGFWRGWRKHVKSIRADAYLTAEIVTVAPEWLRGDEFDAVMNYAWLYPSYAFFSGAAGARQTRSDLDRLRRAYDPDVTLVLQNLLDSHDVGRIASMLANPGLPIREFQQYFETSRVHDRPQFDTRRPTKKVLDRLRQLAVFQMTYPGAPMLYYGTEVGMWGANDPCDRQPMLWDDVVYEPETHTFSGRCKARARKPDLKLFAFFRELIALRNAHPALRRGTLSWVRQADDRVLAFRRTYRGERILVVINAGTDRAWLPKRSPARYLSTGGVVGKPGRAGVEPGGWAVLVEAPPARNIVVKNRKSSDRSGGRTDR